MSEMPAREVWHCGNSGRFAVGGRWREAILDEGGELGRFSMAPEIFPVVTVCACGRHSSDGIK